MRTSRVDRPPHFPRGLAAPSVDLTASQGLARNSSPNLPQRPEALPSCGCGEVKALGLMPCSHLRESDTPPQVNSLQQPKSIYSPGRVAAAAADQISPSPRGAKSHRCRDLDMSLVLGKPQTEAWQAVSPPIMPEIGPEPPTAGSADARMALAADPPMARRVSLKGPWDGSLGSHPLRRGRKPSRVLYPPLGRKRRPRVEVDPAKRWLFFCLGVLLLQVLMEEPGEENPGFLESQTIVAPLAADRPETLFNSSGDEAGQIERTQLPLYKALGSGLPCSGKPLGEETCGAGSSHRRPRES